MTAIRRGIGKCMGSPSVSHTKDPISRGMKSCVLCYADFLSVVFQPLNSRSTGTKAGVERFSMTMVWRGACIASDHPPSKYGVLGPKLPNTDFPLLKVLLSHHVDENSPRSVARHMAAFSAFRRFIGNAWHHRTMRLRVCPPGVKLTTSCRSFW